MELTPVDESQWNLLVLAAWAAGAPPPEAGGARRARAAVIDRAIEVVEGNTNRETEVERVARELAAALRRGRDRLLHDA